MNPRASALSHLERYPNARPSTLRQKAKQDETHERLRREMDEVLRRQQDRTPRQWWDVRRWPAYVWRW